LIKLTEIFLKACHLGRAPQRSAVAQLPRPSPEPLAAAPADTLCAILPARRHLNTHKQTQTHTPIQQRIKNLEVVGFNVVTIEYIKIIRVAEGEKVFVYA
jgi:hypothetical protein